MAQLDEIVRGASGVGILSNGLISVTGVTCIGAAAREVTSKERAGQQDSQLLCRELEPTPEAAVDGHPRSRHGDGVFSCVVSVADHIRRIYLLYPLRAVPLDESLVCRYCLPASLRGKARGSLTFPH
jgi:hypothetical protein